MKNSETGEYELVVGNRQVMGAFFIVLVIPIVWRYPIGFAFMNDVKAALARKKAVANADDAMQSDPLRVISVL